MEKYKQFTPLAWTAIFSVLLIYLWFISIGPWRIRGSTSDYYSRLAASFQHGQLALQEKPDPALLALPNPYDHKARKNIPLLGDASLYDGKYYLYFGPFPGVVLAIVAGILPARPGDQIFVYVFIAGLFLVQCLLFRGILHQFFKDLPGWILPLGILLLGCTGPLTRMLSHPYIHEAAIAGGQFLFMAGFYAAFSALQEAPIRQGRLWLAAILWGCAVATRSTQLVPVAFMAGLTGLYILNKYRKQNFNRELGKSLLALLAPLLVSGLILAWYNWARFDSIFEFGLYYQLAAFNLQANYSILFSRVYLLQNIYNYFLNPFQVTGQFPFFHPLPGTEKPVLASISLPNLYAVEGKFAGALYSTPFLLFSIIPILAWTYKMIEKFRGRKSREGLFNFFDWTVLGLLGSFLAGSLPTLLLFYVGFRYETEFITTLTLLALTGFCQGYVLLRHTRLHRGYEILGIFLGLFSILVSIALAYTGVVNF